MNGVTIQGFHPEKFSYIVPVTEKPKLTYTRGANTEVDITAQSQKHWQATVSYGEGDDARTNTYDVWYYYTNEQVPNADFSVWDACAVYTSAQKPVGWNTIADALGEHKIVFASFKPNDLFGRFCSVSSSSTSTSTKAHSSTRFSQNYWPHCRVGPTPITVTG